MLLKLPIILDNKVVFTLFKLIKYDTYYLLSLFNNIDINDNNCIPKSEGNIIKIIISNNISGYEFYNIYVPLKLFIVDDKLVSIYFFITYFSFFYIDDLNVNYDFFIYLNNILKTKNLQLLKQENYIKYQNNIFEIINSEFILLNNNKKYNKEFWEIINLLLNSILFFFWLNRQKNINIKIPKKIQNFSNVIKQIKYSIDYSEEYTFNNHILSINNSELSLNDLIVNNNYYLLINNKKYLLVKILSKTKNLIKLNNFNNNIEYGKYKWYKYSPDININEKKIYHYLFFNKFTILNLINKFNSKIETKINENIIDYFMNGQIKSKLFSFILENNKNDEIITDINIIKSNSYTIDFFQLVCVKYENNFILILESLFQNYAFPIKYNKKEIDTIFDHILYISLLNINKILGNDKEKLFINPNINVPNKLRLLYFNILKTFHQIINKNKEIIKYIFEPMHIQFIKIFLYSNSLTLELLIKLVTIEELDLFKKKLSINFTIYDIIKRINWNNINKKLHYIKFLLNNKDSLFFYDKLNKNIFPDNFDNRIKNIVINPLNMFKYLRKESDFIKWCYFLEDKFNELYYTNFSISYDNLAILGKIIFCLINIKEQNFTDKYYKKLINYGINFPKLIIENNRINIKIKENFNYIKFNLNLGILAKHLSQNKDNYIDFNDDGDNNEITTLKNKLAIITNKYLKYKKKYYNIKKNK